VQIRVATPTDARAVAEIHVSAWRAAYRGIMPNALLDDLSVEKREGGWRSAIDHGEPQVLVAAEHSQMIGWVASANAATRINRPAPAKSGQFTCIPSIGRGVSDVPCGLRPARHYWIAALLA